MPEARRDDHGGWLRGSLDYAAGVSGRHEDRREHTASGEAAVRHPVVGRRGVSS